MKAHKQKNYEIDMCNGPLVSRILLFALPIALSGILKLAFQAADMMVVGRFVGNDALAAVGSVSTISGFMIYMVLGLSVGVNILIAQYTGLKDNASVEETAHTSILTACIGGGILSLISFILTRPLLLLMNTPADIIENSILYMKIYSLGMIGMVVYDFGSAILRAVGDTRRPMYILLTSGALNMVLNLIFVIPLHMGVAGVAIATTLSNYFSAGCILLCLIRSNSAYRLVLKNLRIIPQKLKRILDIGIPTSIEGVFFDIGNIMIQISINSFGADAIAGNTASGSIEGFAHIAMTCFYQASLSFVSQNFAIGQKDRIRKIVFICLGFSAGIGIVLGNGLYLAGNSLLNLYTESAGAIAFGRQRLLVMGTTLFICGMQEVMRGTLRGMNHSTFVTISGLLCAGLVRVLWTVTIFRIFPNYQLLIAVFPFSYFLILISSYTYYFLCMKKKDKAE